MPHEQPDGDCAGRIRQLEQALLRLTVRVEGLERRLEIAEGAAGTAARERFIPPTIGAPPALYVGPAPRLGDPSPTSRGCEVPE